VISVLPSKDQFVALYLKALDFTAFVWARMIKIKLRPALISTAIVKQLFLKIWSPTGIQHVILVHFVEERGRRCYNGMMSNNI
jgi:hypothetical protein